jgi:hypothetical protein
LIGGRIVCLAQMADAQELIIAAVKISHNAAAIFAENDVGV